MQRLMMKSKIHRATVTDADLHYEGSISIDEKLLEEANMVPYEKVEIYDVDNGARFSTYIIKGKRNSGTICLNGAAARMVAKGDLIIIATYVNVEDEEAKKWKPICVLVDGKNKIKKVSK
ncbi:MAG: aspartate 1-decarboxylase [Deltaproteobacteria bacterium]|nr:aspartate 1-decarboxylase [Deltaproteobacteria bacterium]